MVYYHWNSLWQSFEVPPEDEFDAVTYKILTHPYVSDICSIGVDGTVSAANFLGDNGCCSGIVLDADLRLLRSRSDIYY